MKKILTKILSLTLLLGFASQMQADVRSGLLSYYSFDSSTTEDSVSGNNFTEVNGPVLGVGQRSTTALQLVKSAQQYLRLDHPASHTETGFPIYQAGTYTIAMWVKAPGQTNNYVFTEGATTSNNQIFMLQTIGSAALATTHGNDKLDVYLRNDGNVALLNHVVSSNAVFDDTWHHIAWVDDNGTVKLYVDGVLDAANFNYTRSGTFSADRTAVGTLIRAAISTGNTLNGAIDDLALWERALTEAEIQEVMNSGFPAPVANAVPEIVQQPASVTRANGQSALFSVRAIGPRPFTYVWKTNSVVVPEAVGNTYQIDNLTQIQSGTTISVTISNVNGGILSETAILTIEDSPEITQQPEAMTVVTEGQTITLSVVSIGLEPFTYAWTRDGAPVGGNENPLIISNAQLSDAGEYQVTVFNSAGNDPSDLATVIVNPRPPSPATIAIDFNNRANNTPALTQAGFLPFILDGAGAISTPTKRTLYDNSIDVTVIGAESTADSRLRSTPTNQVDFTEEQLLRDFIFALTAGANKGLDVQFEHLKANQNYVVTVWCFDQGNSGNRESDWYANDTLAKQGYTFSGANLPTSNDQYRISFVAQADASGQLLIKGRQAVGSNGISVFLNAIRLVETELGALPPTITSDLQNVNTYLNAPVTLAVTVSGTEPFSYVWKKGTEVLAGKTSPILEIPNAQFTDAGDYQVFISNLGGSATSVVATVSINVRPPTPSTVGIDINDTGDETEVETEDGFESFALKAIGTGPTTRTLTSGIEMTVGAAGGIAVESRLRVTPTNQVDFTQEKLLRDFAFSRDTNATQGINVELSYLKPGQEYQVTLWSYDSVSGTANRISDWTANGELVKEGYTFIGGTASDPTNNLQYSFSFTVAADSQGKMLIQGRKNPAATGDLNCFLNALQLVEATGLRITDITVGGNVSLTIETPSPSLPHRIDYTGDLNNPNWAELPEVTFGTPVGNVLQAQFATAATNRFFRVALILPDAFLEDDFEGAELGWTSGGTGNPAWEKGTPAVSQGPGAAHGGANVWAVGLTTQYSANSDLWLRSPTIDLTSVSGANLEFWEFRSVDEPFGGTLFHYTAVLIKDASTSEVIAELSKDSGKQTQWTKRSFPIPPAALGKTIIVEFQLVSDSVTAPADRHGWFIDDVAVLPE